MTPKGHFEINWPLAKVLDCIKSAEYFLEFATNRSAMLPQIFWKCAFIKASQIIFHKKSPLLFKVKIVKWQNSWIRNKKVMQSAITKFPIPNINFSRNLVFNQSNFFDERNHQGVYFIIVLWGDYLEESAQVNRFHWTPWKPRQKYWLVDKLLKIRNSGLGIRETMWWATH